MATEAENRMKSFEDRLAALERVLTIGEHGSLTISATSISLDAPTISVNASQATCSGIVRCETIIATNVVGASYTPGAGNIY